MSTETYWTEKVREKLVGRRIVDVRYLTEDEMNDFAWYERGIVLSLDDGNLIYPMRDDEGNGPGAMGTNASDLQTIPVL